MYSINFKQQAVQKVINRGSKSVEQIARELNTSSKNLYRWKKELGNIVLNKSEKVYLNHLQKEKELDIKNAS